MFVAACDSYAPDAASSNFPLKYQWRHEKRKKYSNHNVGGRQDLIAFCRIPGGLSADREADGAELRVEIVLQHLISVPVRRPDGLYAFSCSGSSPRHQIFLNLHRPQLPETHCPGVVGGGRGVGLKPPQVATPRCTSVTTAHSDCVTTGRMSP